MNELVARLRQAAIASEDAIAHDDVPSQHRYADEAGEFAEAIKARGEEGRTAFVTLLRDESPPVRFIATDKLALSDPDLRFLFSKIS